MADVDQDATPTDPTDATTSTSPTSPDGGDPGGGGRRRLWLVVAVLAVVAVAAAGVLALGGDDDDDVATEGDPQLGDAAATTLPTAPEPGTGAGTGGPDAGGAEAAATVAVTFGDVGPAGEPADLTVAFVGPDGSTVAERSWSEVEAGAAGRPDAGGAARSGLVQGVPAGEVTLRATLGDATCEQPFTVAEGDRTILRVQASALGVETDPMDAPIGAGGASSGEVGEPVDPEACATTQSVEDWAAGRSGPTGEGYVGLAVEDAVSRATDAGLETRVVGVDGMDLATTMDFREDRLNLTTFDGVVVAAALDGEGGL